MHIARTGRTAKAALLIGITTAALAGAPAHAWARGPLLDEELRPPELAVTGWGVPAPDLSLPSARGVPHRLLTASAPDVDQGGRGDSGGGAPEAEEGQAGEGKEAESERPADTPEAGALDFDLLGAPAEAARVDEKALRLRRTMLNLHQGVGLGMFALDLATTVVGQLNYGDKFHGGDTNKYAQTHAILAYSTLAAFVAAGSLALFAPSSPVKPSEGFDRISLHRLAMFTAAAGMLAEGVLGVWTQSREGHLNQQSVATAHLVIGYVTFAAVATGVSALIF